MRGIDHQQGHVFSYLSPEERVRKDHPLRAVRVMTEEVLRDMSSLFDAMYARRGRPSIPPEKLLRAQLLQMLYSVRSERLLMEEIDYSMLFRWFVGLNLDEEVWDATTSPRIGIGCWKPTWRRNFWRRWWSGRGTQG
jgi:transposase